MISKIIWNLLNKKYFGNKFIFQKPGKLSDLSEK